MQRFDYMICSSQLMKVTFVNGRWQGTIAPDQPSAMDTCPDLWEFLQHVGGNGWELISVTSEPIQGQSGTFSNFYFKRIRV